MIFFTYKYVCAYRKIYIVNNLNLRPKDAQFYVLPASAYLFINMKKVGNGFRKTILTSTRSSFTIKTYKPNLERISNLALFCTVSLYAMCVVCISVLCRRSSVLLVH